MTRRSTPNNVPEAVDIALRAFPADQYCSSGVGRGRSFFPLHGPETNPDSQEHARRVAAMSDQSPRPESAAIPHWHHPESDVATIVAGDGARVTDDEGREYLDFVAQLYCVNAGHGDADIAEAMREQAERVAYVSSAKHNDTRSALAARIADRAPGALSDVFFSVSGSEANETAAMLAREHTGAGTVLTRWRSYHGGTYGAGSFTGDPQTRGLIERHAATTGTGKFLPPLPDAFDGATGEELARRAADHLEYVVRNEGPDSIAAILTEPVGGTSGSFPAPPGYFQRVRDICDEYGILLVADEVITGFGRCGGWWGVETEGIEPDVLTFAKGVTSGYAPLGGVVVRSDIARGVREEGFGLGQTFGGHPVSCAAGVAAMDAYEDGLVANARELGPYMEERLRELEAHDVVHRVHGRGLLWAVEFRDPATGEPFVDPRVDPDADNPVSEITRETTDRGVLVGTGRPNFFVIISPPLCIDEADVDEAVAALDGAISAVF
jgi:taurine--2-oxoglutarate transaminase